MSQPGSDAASKGSERDVEEIAARLYALRPDEFVAARDQQVRNARAAGSKDLASELNRLRRPTQSAWLVNTLWRDQRDVIESLLETARQLRDPEAEVSAKQLHELTAKRRELDDTVTRRAGPLGEAAGVSVTSEMVREAQETFGAALSSPEAAEQVRSGRLAKPLSYAGFGTALVARSSNGPTAVPPPAHEDVATSGGRAKGREHAQRRKGADQKDDAGRRERAERQERAESRVHEAAAAVDAADQALAERSRELESSQQRHRRLRDEVAQLREQLRELEQQVTAARREAQTQQRRHDQAQRKQDEARRALERAERQRDSG